MEILDSKLKFPSPKRTTREGLVAVGGDLSPERLLLAYGQGIFPWPTEGLPMLWFCPNPRFVLPLDVVRCPKSLRKSMRKERFVVTTDTAFVEVMSACAASPRSGQSGTWITQEMLDGYAELHRLGYAHSVETWEDGKLVGGLYGVSLGDVFFGESMFSLRPDASKVAFITLVAHLKAWGLSLIDCQVHTDHLARFGAENWSRDRFLSTLRTHVANPTRKGPWSFHLQTAEVFDVVKLASK